MEYNSYEIIQGNIYLEITSKCNLHCNYCYNDSQINGSQLALDKIKNLMQYSVSVGVNNMAISGGEPLLHPDIISIIEYAANINMHLYIITNGSMLNKDFFDKIKPYMCYLSFQFTFDGYTASTHAKSRGENNYTKIKQCISYLISNGYSEHIFLRYNITAYNFSEVYSFLEYCHKIHCKTVSLSFILNQGRANEEILTTDNQENKVKALVEKAQLEFPELVIKFSDKPVITCPYALVRPNQRLTFLPRIDSKGNVYPCQVEVNPDYIVGNIYEDSLFDIMYSEKFNKYITYVTRKEERNKKCRNCTISKLCGGGCVAMKTCCDRIKSEILHGFLK